MNCGKCGALLPPEIENIVRQGGPCFCYPCFEEIEKQKRERPEVDDLIDNVIPEFCDEYCRFPREHIVDFMADDSSMECTNCPMIKINNFLEDLKNGKQQ